MSQDEHRVDPDSEPGGYGTPTPEQEMPGQGSERETPERPAEGAPEVTGDEFPTPKDPDAAPPPSATGSASDGG
ncbi:hypothetical protein [Paenarthrobacter aurescens]|uniref:hypothetical protein n=1 Tax=Paenarthrobacter aurescens TaxID=43663 RepID=UPI0021C0915E|nr:hypothetical protein [Paenarthrobacter aurescens]MCT9871375.1 hypothetical protein [Paenarthrobacter aurescens]